MSATDHGKTAFATCHGLFKFQVMPFGLCNARAPLVSSCLGYPFERIAIDIMAPLPVTVSGNKYILVVGDYFTKWKEAYVSHHQCDWDGHLPLVMMAYRSSIHGVQLPVDVMFGRQPNHQLEVSEYVRDLRDTLEEVHEHAREHLRTAQKRQKDYYDQRIAGEQIKVGDRVFLHDPAVKKGQTKKLHSPWQGPYIVMTKIGDVTYRIQAEDNPRKRKVVHFNRLKLCGVPRLVDKQRGPSQTASSGP